MSAFITNIQGYSIHDGPGIRTVVFLKGCGLECQWCSNPECISPKPEVGFIKKLCVKCSKCAEVCPVGALIFESDQMPRIDRKRCSGCGECSAVCSYKAIVLYGEPKKPDEIFEILKRDKMFYDASGGGVTVSGGEALLQPEFVHDLFEKCQHAGIRTCLETSGYASESALRHVLPFTDNVLYDLKHLNSIKHLEYTGKPNNLILSNAKVVASSGVETLFRMPLIPGVNDDLQNIEETAKFLHILGGNFSRIELMPYHGLGKGKYESIDKEYRLPGIISPEQDKLESLKNTFELNDIICSISR